LGLGVIFVVEDSGAGAVIRHTPRGGEKPLVTTGPLGEGTTRGCAGCRDSIEGIADVLQEEAIDSSEVVEPVCSAACEAF